jgi:hypothetical protein
MDDPFLPDYIRRAIEMHRQMEELTRQFGVDSPTQRAIRALDEQMRPMRDMQQRLIQDQNQLKRLVDSLPSVQLGQLSADRRLLDQIESMDAARAAFVKSLTPTFADQLSALFKATSWSNIGPTALDSLQSFLASTPHLSGIGVDSVVRFAEQWGAEGMQQQLNALLSSRDWELDETPDGAGVSKAIRVALAGPWAAFIYFLLGTLLSLYALHDSAEMKKDLAETKKELTDEIREGREETTSHINAIEQLLEDVLAAQQKQQADAQRVQLVVKEREALIRSGPESRTPVIARARPYQAVWLIEDDGEWIRVEYDDPERQRITGCALKMRFAIQPSSR